MSGLRTPDAALATAAAVCVAGAEPALPGAGELSAAAAGGVREAKETTATINRASLARGMGLIIFIAEYAFSALASTGRCAGEGELVFGLTKHCAILTERRRGVNRQFLRVFGRPWARTGGVLLSCRMQTAEGRVPEGELWRLRKPKRPSQGTARRSRTRWGSICQHVFVVGHQVWSAKMRIAVRVLACVGPPAWAMLSHAFWRTLFNGGRGLDGSPARAQHRLRRSPGLC